MTKRDKKLRICELYQTAQGTDPRQGLTILGRMIARSLVSKANGQKLTVISDSRSEGNRPSNGDSDG